MAKKAKMARVRYQEEKTVEKEFIHWEFIAKMCELIRDGYSISRV